MKSCGDLSLGTLFLQLQLRSMVLSATANPSEDMEDFAKLLPLRLINTTTEQVLSYASQQGFALSGQVIAILHELESVRDAITPGVLRSARSSLVVRHRNRHCLLVSSVAGSIKFVFKALGWLFAEGGDKAPCGVVTIDNTDGCKGALFQTLDDVILSKKLGRPDALRLRGKLQSAAGQVAGRLARKSLNVVTKHAYSMCGVDLDEPTVGALRLHRTFISASAQNS